MKDRVTIWTVSAALVALFIIVLIMIAPTEEDIQRCSDAFEWTTERCRFELTR